MNSLHDLGESPAANALAFQDLVQGVMAHACLAFKLADSNPEDVVLNIVARDYLFSMIGVLFDTNGIAIFLESTKDVSEVRDAHHHYYSQIENRSQKKRKTFPLYGAVSWTYGVGARPQGVHFVTCWKGAMHEPKVTAGFQIPGNGLRLPIGNLHLQAFDYDIDLQKVTDAVASLIQRLNTDVAELARIGLDKVAAEHNVDREKLNANVAADMFFALWGEISWSSSGPSAP